MSHGHGMAEPPRPQGPRAQGCAAGKDARREGGRTRFARGVRGRTRFAQGVRGGQAASGDGAQPPSVRGGRLKGRDEREGQAGARVDLPAGRSALGSSALFTNLSSRFKEKETWAF